MDIKIINHTGDILGDYAVKNIMNYNNNQDSSKVISEITKLIQQINKSEIEDKNILIENIQQKTENPLQLKEYLESLSSISSISSNIIDVIQALGFGG